MKKLLIFIVLIALFLHFYPQPKLTLWYEEQKAAVLATFSSATDTRVRLKADKIYTDLKSQFDNFNDNEQEYLKDLTQSREKVQAFYTDYCKGKKSNPNFHHKNQARVCKKIEEYSALL